MQATFQQHLEPCTYVIYPAVSTQRKPDFFFFSFQSLIKLELQQHVIGVKILLSVLKQVVLVFDQEKRLWCGVLLGSTTAEFFILSPSFLLRATNPISISVGCGVLERHMAISIRYTLAALLLAFVYLFNLTLILADLK